jgi:hypothetical protein
MRLSDWRKSAPTREAMSAKVVGVVEPVLRTLGADRDPECWVVWGDDPSTRWVVLAPTDAGLIVAHVRVAIPGEGPRASAKLVRWNRVQLGELGVETQTGRRLVTFQAEGHVLRGVDEEADAVGAFAIRLIAAADGRPLPAAASSSRAARPTRAGAGRNPRAATPPTAPTPPARKSRPTARTQG